MAKRIYVVFWRAESGDDGVEGYFTELPTDEHLTAYFKDLTPWNFDGEGEDERRMIWWEVYELGKLPLPEPIKVIESI